MQSEDWVVTDDLNVALNYVRLDVAEMVREQIDAQIALADFTEKEPA